jgi:transcriptional regulator with XRE-family HTH domain
VQQEINLNAKIKALLIELRSDLGLSNREIAENISVSETYLSNVFNGSKEGSEQLLAGLKLLRRVIELESAPPPKTDRERIEELEERLAQVEKRWPAVVYPPPRTSALVLNDAAEVNSARARKELRRLENLRRGLELLGVPVPPSIEPK